MFGFVTRSRLIPVGPTRLTGLRFGHELAPRYKIVKKKQKGRVTVRTGSSTKGNTLKFGSYGMRLKTEGLRVSEAHLKAADNVLVKYVKAGGGKLWKRLCTNVAICIKGNATRMGKGKGDFDHWAARVPTGKVVFEVDHMHEREAKEALRKACDKLPGVWEFITKDSATRIGLKSMKTGEDETVNYAEKLRQQPSKAYKNFLKSREDRYQKYTGRK